MLSTETAAVERADALPWILMAVLTLSSLVSRPLLPIDETRYLSVAWEMHESGDYLVSHLNGQTYAHKPPLLFWLINAIWCLTGVSDFAARLVGPIVSLGSVLMTRQLARQLWPGAAAAARIATVVHCSSMLWLLLSTLTMFDSLLTLCVQISMLGVLRMERELSSETAELDGTCHSYSLPGMVVAGLGLGLGILAKGPVVLIHVLPAAVLGIWWSAAVRQAIAGWYLRLSGSLLIAAVIGLSWAIPSAMSGGEAYAEELLWGQTANRMVSSFAHQEPWWWYLTVLPLIALPWISWGALWRPAARHSLPRNDRFLWGWIVSSVFLLSLISGKQLHYLLPVVPCVALIIARRVATLSQPVIQRDLLFIVWGTVAGGLLPLICNVWPDVSGGRLAGICPTWLSIPLCLCGLSLLRIKDFSPEKLVRRVAVSAVCFISILVAGLSLNFWHDFDLTRLARHVSQLQQQDIPVAWYGEFHGQLHFVGRLQRPITELQTESELAEWQRKHPHGRVVLRVLDPGIPIPADQVTPLSSTELKRVSSSLQLSARSQWPGFVPELQLGCWLRRGLTSGLMVVAQFHQDEADPLSHH